MSWKRVLGQAHAVAALRQAVERDRVAHAYMLFGPDGVGKRAVALAFARTLLCETGGTAPCESCRACGKTSRMLHADLHYLMPYAGEPGTADITRRLKLVAEDPYASTDYARRPHLDDPEKGSNRQVLYPIERVHQDLIRPLTYKPVEGRYKIAVVTDADRMRKEGANAFLKRLEEPSGRAVILLTTSRPDRLLPTIVSRCQKLRLDRLSDEIIEAELVRRSVHVPATAGTVARMADGSMTKALDLAANTGLLEDRELMVKFLRWAYSRDIGLLSDGIGVLAGMGRERLKHLLGLLLNFVRDLVTYRALGDAARLINVDQREAVARFCGNVEGADLSAMSANVEEAVHLLERNVNASLVLRRLASALGAAMREGTSTPLYRPLVEID